MKKKNQMATLIDDLRNQDPKKRLNSVQQLKQIASALGPLRARTQFIQYLAEFIDDEQHIVLQLLNQLSDFASYLGGQEHEKCLLPLLIGFCKTDQKKQAQKASQIMESVLRKNKDLIADAVKKLSKTQMSTSKQASIKIISSLINLVPQSESQLLEIYGSMIFSDIPAYRIIGARYLPKLLENVKNKQEIGKLIELVYNDTDDLPKIFALEALANFYPVNPNAVLAKFKALFVINNWRINIKICEVVNVAAKVFSKAHLKSTFEASLLKFIDSQEPELRAKSCNSLKVLASIMSEQDIRKILIPAVKRLSNDQVDYVKQEMSENIVSMIEVCSASIINDELLPIIFTFIKSNDLALGIIKNFESMTKKLSSDTIEQKILGPLTSQFSTDNWRTKCRMIELLGNVINNSLFLNDKMTNMLMSLVCDRINAVRQKATELMISIILQQSPQWCDTSIIPKLQLLKESQHYIERQVLLQIIEKTADKVTDKTLNEFYRSVVVSGLNDKVSNVRAKALKALRGNKKLYDKVFDKYVEKLKNDTDGEVKELAMTMVIKV